MPHRRSDDEGNDNGGRILSFSLHLGFRRWLDRLLLDVVLAVQVTK